MTRQWAAAAAILALAWIRSPAQESRVIVLHYADSLVGRVIGGQEARELIGNVSISQESVRINCDHAIQFLQTGIVQLDGNVVIRDESTTLRSPRAVYHRDERRAEAFDGVSLDDGKVRLTSRYGEYLVKQRQGFFRDDVTVVDSASVITADSLTYFRTTRRSIAVGRVRVVTDGDRLSITGGRLEHDQPLQFSRMTINPVLVQVDTGGGGPPDTLVVRSLVMEAYRDSARRLVAMDSVRMAGHDLGGRSGYAVFFSQADSMVLRRSPVVWYQHTQVSGDSMHIFLLHRKLHRVLVTGSAVAVSEGDSLHRGRFDQMVGETMHMTFEQHALRRIEVDTRAIGLYHLYDDTASNGLNKISGDRIVMQFNEGALRTIKIAGGVEGQYYPENLVHRREDQYAIPGARWRGDRPRMLHGAAGAVSVE